MPHHGVLVRNKTFGMSGRVLTIGFILFAPSILAKLAAGLMIFGVLVPFGGNTTSGSSRIRGHILQSNLPAFRSNFSPKRTIFRVDSGWLAT